MALPAAYKLLFYRSDAAGDPAGPEDLFLRQIGGLLAGDDPADRLNCLAHHLDAEQFPEKFLGEIFKAFVSCGVLPDQLAGPAFSPDADFLLRSALDLCRRLRDLPGALPPEEAARLLPRARHIFDGLPDFRGDTGALAQALRAADPFRTERVFTYHHGEFYPVKPSSVKDVSKFFGFPGVRAAFAEHFAAFAAGRTNLPLLVNSLPGYGKTSMVISFALAAPETVVILADPDALSAQWNRLIDALGVRQDRRFVLFFDDIDPRKVDWYFFRTNVGGAFTPPANIMPVLAANYEFPPSILSRGRRITYPVFDEERCMEMIEDFLGTFGMKHPPRNIVSLMGAEYTEEFGQKKFTELSPRTLMRHLALYHSDQRKRKQIVELSGGGMITKPDGELFYEFNIELMRSMYGEQYIQRLLKERLKSL